MLRIETIKQLKGIKREIKKKKSVSWNFFYSFIFSAQNLFIGFSINDYSILLLFLILI